MQRLATVRSSRRSLPGCSPACSWPARPRLPAHAAETYSAPLQTAISGLPVATEVRTGYARDKFRLWVDADGDGCDTRKEVLISEADDPVTVGSGCSLSGGRWFSYYDRVSWTDSGRIDIDHVVPLAEAWDSGARAGRRRSASRTPTTSATTARWSASPTRSTSPRATRTRPSGCRRTTSAATSASGSR